MNRWLAGIFDPNGSDDSSQLAGIRAARTVALSGLTVAYSGQALSSLTTLCLFDGFLDNAAELRDTLGEMEDSSPPEELVVAAYRRWGSGLPVHLRGDFALLIWEPERRDGILIRDHLGIRSLFLHESSGRLYFATELRYLLALLPRRPSPDPNGIAHWVTTIGRPGSGTMYEGVRRLHPGSMLTFNRDGVRENQYWTLKYADPSSGTEPELAHELQNAITHATKRKLSSSNNLTGVLMSGGLDSSTVAATASRVAPGAVRAYSAEFPDHPAVDESELITELRRILQLPGVTASVRAGGLLASALEWINTWQVPLTSWGEFWCGPLLTAAASDGVDTVLGGDGGDELFSCRAYLMADRLRAGHPREALRLARELPGAGNHPARRALLQEAREYAVLGAMPGQMDEALSKLRQRGQLPRWLRPSTSKELAESMEPAAWKRLDGPRWWAHDAHALTRGVEQLGLFENHHRRAATAGLHSRHPLFDVDLVEIGMRHPPLGTFNRFHDRPLLRSSMQGLVPDSVRLRPFKALFDSLLMDSLTGADGAASIALLSDPNAELAAYLDLQELRHALLDRRPRTGPEAFRWCYQVWRLLTAECWLRVQNGNGIAALESKIRASPSHIVLRKA